MLVALEGEAVASTYVGVFESDWSGRDGGGDPLSAGLLGGVAAAVCDALLVARRIEFVGRNGVATDWQW